MALGYKTRRRLSLLILLVGLPLYVAVAASLMSDIQRLPIWAEVPAYIILGVVWILPFKAVFTGIGKPDPDAEPSARADP